MSVNALSGHGTLIKRNGTTIAELGDITPPALSRNEFDATTQLEDIDSYIMGVLRRGPVTFGFNFIPTNTTHDHTAGLLKAIVDKAMDRYDFIFPDGTTWIASGQVQSVVTTGPVDGKLSGNVTLRFSGPMIIGGTTVGASV
jgi:hypothetical protein